MQYAEYRKKMVKLAGILGVMKRFRVLIISACLIVVALIATLLSVRGIVYEVSDCPQTVVYGEDLGFRAKAVMGGVVYQYSTDGGKWSETRPVRAGDYNVRACSKSISGKPRYSSAHAFTIVPRQITVRAAESAVYGDDPELIADLPFEDSVSCSKFIYGDKYAVNTDVLPDKDSIVITDKDGVDVTSSYIITAEQSEITINRRVITVAAESAEKEYDGLPLTADGYDLRGATLAYGDVIVYGGCRGGITDAGVADNEITGSVRIYSEHNEDVTDMYSLTKAKGILTVTKRKITVQSASAEKEYDGTALSCPDYYDDGRLVAGHKLSVSSFAQLTDAGERDNTLGFTVTDWSGADKTANYAVELNAGKLTVTRRKVTVTTEDMDWIYDGKAHGCNEYFDTDGFVADNEIINSTSKSAITEVGSVENVCEMRVYNYKTNKDVTANYEITVLYGTLTVNAALLEIYSDDFGWIYDGTAHSHNGFAQEGLADGQQINATAVSQITDVGECKNVISVKVYAGKTEVTSNYKIVYFWGSLKVSARSVTVTADGAEKFYDGTPLTCPTVSADNLAAGHRVYGAAYGGGTDAGRYTNKVNRGSVVISDAGGEAVTSNYQIEFADGELTVKPRPVTFVTADGEWLYDGETYSAATCKIADNSAYGLVSGHRYVVESYTGICDAGDKENRLTLRILQGETDVTANYEIIYDYGVLKIKPRPVTVTTADSEKVYDGKPCTKDGYSLTSSLSPALVKDHYEEVTFTGVQTDAGKGKNTVSVKILSADGDKTSNYDITVNEGTLTVTKRPVTVISRGGEWWYDGSVHTRRVFEFSQTQGMGLAEGQNAELVSSTGIIDAGTDKNVITVKITADGADVTANYEISYVYGDLIVKPRPVTLTADSAEKDYDGTPLKCGTVSGDNLPLVTGHKATAATAGSQTAVGESANRIVEGTEVIRDSNGKNVTKNYSVNYADGLLKVTPRGITVKAGDAQKIYDGEPLTCALFSVISKNQLLSGHTLTLKTSGSRTDAGDGINTIIPSSVKIVDAYGVNVSANYKVNLENGALTVTRRAITVTAGNAEKEYDGKPLTCTDYTVQSVYDPALVKDHKLTAVISGSQTLAGTAENVVEKVTIFSKDGDVTDNYAISVKNGNLTVRGKKITVITVDGGWTYDGKYHQAKGFGYNGLLEGHFISCKEIFSYQNAGSYENIQTVSIVYNGGDVTANYNITYIYGTVTVEKREVHLTTASGEWVYDGLPHSNPQAAVDGDSPYALVEGHRLSFSDAAEIVGAGEAGNVLAVNVINGEYDETANYDLHLVYGMLKVAKRPVTVTYGYDNIYFTGAPLNRTVSGFGYFKSVSEYPLLSGTQISVTVRCDRYDLGAADLYFEEGSAKITDYNNKDQTENYSITLLSKQVNIVKRRIVLNSLDAEKVYDGMPLTYEKYKVLDVPTAAEPFVRDAIIGGHNLEAEVAFTGSQTLIGEGVNSFTVENFKVTDADGNDISYGYETAVRYGNLYVTEFGSLYVTTGGAEKVYDGTPLTNGYYTVRSTLLDGYTYKITVTGSQTEIGFSYNTFDVTVHSPDGADVTCGLRLVADSGLLRVLEKLESGGQGDLDLSGGIGGGSGSGRPPVTALKVCSEADGQVYMRLQSYGAYTGKGWNSANPYTGTVDGKYGMNYLTGFALGGAGRNSVNMRIEVAGSGYYLPYYLSSGEYGYNIQQSDVLYTGDTSKVYSLNYYPYNYLQEGAVKLYLQELAAAEREYRQFVYENYLAVPESTAGYLKSVIAAQGFDISDSGLAAKIAYYIQNCATYNLNYNVALDDESDVVVSFLRDYKQGVCRHYASAATLLYRAMGIPARYTIGYTGVAVAGEWVEITTENAHAWVEIYVDGMGWVQIEVTGSDESDYGELDLGTLRPADVTKQYDGKPLVANRLIESGKLAGLLAEGFTYTARFGGSRTDVGTSSSYVAGFALYDPEGKPVLSGVNWTSGEGKLTVVPSGTLITVHLYYLACEYDGLSHSLGRDDWFAEGLPAGFRLEFDPSTIQVSAANGFDWNAVKALPLKLFNSSGYDVTANYNIIFSFESEQGSDGEGIDISCRAVTVTTQSAEKEYDGTPLRNGEWWISFGALADGHRMEVEVDGECIDVGTAENKVGSCKIFDRNGNDVTANYSIKFNCGTLKVFD